MTDEPVVVRRRRRPRIHLLSLCEKRAEAEGLNLETLVWSVVKGLFVAAGNGDISAAKLLFHHFVEHDENAPPLPADVHVDARSVTINGEAKGPPAPRGAKLADYLAKFAEQLRAAPALAVEDAAAGGVVEHLLA